MQAAEAITLFFVIIQGDYDELLVWPFRQRVTLPVRSEGNPEAPSARVQT